jgi:hypothetical protein
LLCLGGGALLAVSQEGVPRLLFGGSAFAGYLFFFAHALREIGLPAQLWILNGWQNIEDNQLAASPRSETKGSPSSTP